MSYTDNPRKVYGKVEIIYADTDISSVTNLTVTSEAEISHKNEVYGSYLIPTVKACTMDGNSTMDGTYQMMDSSCVLGWWSGSMADSTGVINQTIILTFETRPITSWTIIGDTKLDQYPKDFTVTFKRNGATVQTETITNNSNVTKKLYVNLINITSIEMTITKWSKANACVKLLNFFDMLSETYEGSDLLSFEVNEEMSPEDASYNINSDSMSVTIYNKDKKFTTGYLKDLLVLDRKVKPYIGVMVNNTIVYTSLGTFYSDEWKITEDGMFIKCTAVDKLIRLQNKSYVGLNLSYNMSLYEIAEDVLTKAGITDYEISDNLEDINVPTSFLEKQSVWDALQEIANAGLCKIFIDRDNKIVIRSELDTKEASGITINSSNAFSYNSNISLTEFANKINVEYCDVEIGDSLVDAAETSITLESAKSITLTIDYTVEVASSVISCDNENLTLSNFTYGVNACTVTVTNNTATSQTGTLKIQGYSIDITYKTISTEDERSVKDYGVFEYNHTSSSLVQSSALALSIASTILNRMKAGEGVITTKWRGNPALELGMTYTNDSNTLECEYNKFSYDGGLVQETRGRKE